ncbi:MAG: hypothetical protein ACE10G_07565, partial [Gemmatimonadales bacterium]
MAKDVRTWLLGQLGLGNDGRSHRWRIFRLFLAGLLVTTTVLFACVDRSVVHRFEQRATSFPSRVYAAPYKVAHGSRIDVTSLLEQLKRREYHEVSRDPERAGEFRRDRNDWV